MATQFPPKTKRGVDNIASYCVSLLENSPQFAKSRARVSQIETYAALYPGNFRSCYNLRNIVLADGSKMELFFTPTYASVRTKPNLAKIISFENKWHKPFGEEWLKAVIAAIEPAASTDTPAPRQSSPLKSQQLVNEAKITATDLRKQSVWGMYQELVQAAQQAAATYAPQEVLAQIAVIDDQVCYALLNNIILPDSSTDAPATALYKTCYTLLTAMRRRMDDSVTKKQKLRDSDYVSEATISSFPTYRGNDCEYMFTNLLTFYGYRDFFNVDVNFELCASSQTAEPITFTRKSYVPDSAGQLAKEVGKISQLKKYPIVGQKSPLTDQEIQHLNIAAFYALSETAKAVFPADAEIQALVAQLQAKHPFTS